jgi:hypothetical protein
MTLDDELRSTFREEATRRAAPPPPLGELISGGRSRRRRARVSRAAVAVAAVAVLATATYGVVRDGGAQERSEEHFASQPPPLAQSGPGNGPLAPGDYQMLVGVGDSEVIEADVTVEGGTWRSGDFAVVSSISPVSYAGFGAYQPVALAAGNGCHTGPTTGDLGRTPEELAAQLAALPRSRVLQPPAPAEAFGRDAIHLRLRIDADCPGFYRVADTVAGERGITYTALYAEPEPVVIDFWVLDLGGTPVVVDVWHNRDAPDDLIRTAERAKDSVQFVTD